MIDDDPELGKCSKCAMMQCLDSCESTLNSRLMIKSSTNDNIPITLLAFSNVLNQKLIVANCAVTEISLLKAPPFSISFKHGIIHSASRC